MDVLENTDILEQSKSVLAPHFANALQGLVDHPIVGQVRSKGLVAAVELVRDKGSESALLPSRGQLSIVVIVRSKAV